MQAALPAGTALAKGQVWVGGALCWHQSQSLVKGQGACPRGQVTLLEQAMFSQEFQVKNTGSVDGVCTCVIHGIPSSTTPVHGPQMAMRFWFLLMPVGLQ